ncbi:menaquinone-dependent protoporphyrinogen oxidase [Nicoletella semolina]|uniref:Protoporphyrinogen IX dehydrogenase [quinone] n=1 Tax=Nicoletella semolina TaxID=271160 RepID=A0A4R2N9Y0_9PAST|nr:menaquinone-dependent protoporphyrinogen IX dehydrogenase [Nicoletella semolina]MDH2925307.1 protoporphyrinogen oxidase [Nicoletella semolina]TCP17782.1 menaquinone-dependent protoporphyrinogen oxidase [Nicoletella semolina]
MRTVIFYLTQDGQTEKIAYKIAAELGNCKLVSLREQPNFPHEELLEFDKIVIGASIRYGRFDPLLEKFIAQHQGLLNQKSSAFFSVNLTARKSNRNTPKTNTYTRKLLARIQWQPSLIAVIAGALRYPRYHWFDRIMIQFIMKITGGETDTQKEVEYTDWQQVATFSEQISQLP